MLECQKSPRGWWSLLIACILRGSEALMPFGVCPRVACVGLISVVALFITPITYTTAKDQCKCEVRMLNKKIQCSSPLGHHGQSLFPSLVQCHQPPSSLPANAGSFLLAFFLPRSGMQFKVKFFLRHIHRYFCSPNGGTRSKNVPTKRSMVSSEKR